MESKRKASGANGPEPTADTDRAAKRRKLIEEYGDLADGETSESTTAYGLNILESIRATTDKNGRSVSPYFETLPSRSKNAQYYKRIRLPLSLEVIERKLKERQYATLSSLESDFKRLVSNAKETNDRSSTIFGDAERVRKAVSNLMVKYNPAYKSGNYQAVPTPLPPTPEPEEEEDEEEEEEEEGGDEEAEDEAEEDTGVQAKGEDESEPGTQNAVDDAEAQDVEEEDEEEADEDQDQEEAEGEDEDEDSQPKRRRGSSRRKAGSRARDSTTPAQRSTPRTGKTYRTYEGVPFKGLSLVQAQEKIVDELIRKKDADDYPYFEPFISLPPRALKDYYDVIAEPLALKTLQRQIRGANSRNMKNWAAFEDQASLIWKNAYHYNEDGSDIFIMAQELEESFQDLLKEAKAAVPDPPKIIKLKVPPKVTLHYRAESSVTASPAPVTGQSGDSEAVRNETPVNKNSFNSGSSTGTTGLPAQLEKTRSMSASAGPPSPSVKAATKTEDAIQMVPTVQPQAPPTTFQHFVPVTTMASAPMMNGAPPPQYQPPLPPPPPKRSASDILEAQKYRPQPITEAEALMPRLVIATHPSLPVESKLVTTFVASPTEYQQEIVVNAPMSHYRVQLKPQVASFLESGQREWKLNVIHDATPLYPTLISFDKRGESIFEVTLRYGVNRIEVRLIAALPRDETAPNGLNMEMERFVIHYNLLRH